MSRKNNRKKARSSPIKKFNRKPNQKIKNARPVQHPDGRNFKSKIESFCCQKLFEAGIDDFKYEGYKFTIQEAFEFNNTSTEVTRAVKDGIKGPCEYKETTNNIRAITYTPDFGYINPETKEGWIIETKGFATDSFTLKWKMFKKYLTDNNYIVSLYKPSNQGTILKTIEIIKNKYYG